MRPQPPFHSSGGAPPPRKRLGQNFLVDRGAARRIVESLTPAPDDLVCEIGPGRGVLTALLLENLRRMAAVEIDQKLASLLRQRFGARLHVLEGNVLRLDFGAIVAVLGGGPEDGLLLLSNLPYNISKPVVQKLVRERDRVLRAVLTFQREVAARLTAKVGSRSYGPMTILAGEFFRIERLFDLPPRSFRPRPRVFSTVTRWQPLPPSTSRPASLAALRACLAASFARRRQTLLGNLRASLPGGAAEARALLEEAGIDGSLRAEAVPPDAFRRLASLWPRPPGRDRRRPLL